ncbi:uncharacterized protein LOC128200193 [Galleria mellonella]|uniref:Uncharacterized protein LOC128200193 n=1 Tax=Galleria mellonella TaxID=7137 RepID=A0ABM3MBI4_GALME|nr:uncharacterized protein LOC128200193 [Galleria mellonella]
MFVQGVDVLSSTLENISLDIQNKMQPKTNKTPVCPKGQLPLLHLTPVGGEKNTDVNSQQETENPCLLKPHYDMPPTPPPQTNPQSFEFFPQRIG